MKKIFYLLGIAGIATIASCKKERYGLDENSITKIAPNGFDYKTSVDVNLDVRLLTNNDQPIAGAVISIYSINSNSLNDALYKGVTDQNGYLKTTLNVDASVKQLVVDPAYVGLMRYAKVNINKKNITATIGGKNGYSGDIVSDDINNTNPGSGSANNLGSLGLFLTEYSYPSPYTSTADAVLNTSQYPLNVGRPKYLETTPDLIDNSLLSFINSSLPESQSVTVKHPEYLAGNAMPNINVIANSDVWLTYVSEGASYQSSLAYYTYNTANPPTRTSGGTILNGIDKVTMVFPNASGTGSGGALKSGDKVKLGTFTAGTTIAFVLLQNSWTGNSINLNAQKFYSDVALNPENTTSLKKHSIVLYDDVHKLYLLGFEDTNRETPATNPNSYASDNDFNDAVFYATSNPINGISNVDVPPIDKGGDSDGDGVLDPIDAFPNDPTKAYINYFPSKAAFAQLAFEDNWPAKGDYDLNDLIVNYRYTFVLNAKNEVVTMQGDFHIAAAGASFHNGFGLQLPVNASAVKSVTGQKTISNYIQFASNGVEAGQSKAVIIPFDNHEALIHYPDYSYLINTLNEKDKAPSDTASVLVTFAAPVSISGLSISAINPFIIGDLTRGREAHLPGYLPTDKADKTLFATSEDASLVNGRPYYTSKENWPWAISFNSTSFKYPLERVKITDAYPHFADWAGSNGTNFQDWYSNLTTGYRVNSNIYLK